MPTADFFALEHLESRRNLQHRLSGGMAPQLSLQAKRFRTIIVTVPIIGAASCESLTSCFSTSISVRRPLIVVLYKRLVLGEPRRMLPRNDPEQAHKKLIPITPADKA